MLWFIIVHRTNGTQADFAKITKGLAGELAADKIRVNAILPVAGETAMLVKTSTDRHK